MATRYEYLVCAAQEGRLTFINGAFQGRVRGNQEVMEVRERMYESCPDYHVALEKLGEEGWELVSACPVTTEHGMFEKLYFKRPKTL